MNPGTLDRKIQLQRATTTADRFGQEVPTWAVWKTRMAARLKTKGKEGEANARERAEASVTFRLRYTAGLTATDRLVDTRDGQAYDIEDWDGDERQGWMEIYCTRHRTPENEKQAIQETQPDAMVVEGAGLVSVRGLYFYNGLLEERPSYLKYQDAEKLRWTNAGSMWDLGGAAYQGPEDVPTPDLVLNWITMAPAPPPTVRRATWADIDAAGIDRSTVPTL